MNIAPDWFKEWFDSPYYHKLYFERDELEANAFISRLLTHLNPPAGSTMLDLACGRGRHARMLAAKGYDVTGIDLAANSIAYARQWENEHLHFYVHDMRQIFYANYFNYVFNFFTSFGYFHTEREHSNVLRTVSIALKKGGFFVMDYLNAPYTEQRLVHTSQKILDGVVYDMKRWTDQRHFYKNIRITDKALPAPLDYTEKVEKFSLEEFRQLFAKHGLPIKEVFGGYDLSPYDVKDSPRMVIVAVKN